MGTKRAASVALGLCLAVALVGCSRALTVQTEANRSNASAGEAGASIGSSALISVQVNRAASGAPVDGLGTTTGDGSAEVSLPTSWSLRQGFNVPPGGCLMTPTQFVNQGRGTYTIRVVPFLTNTTCKWLSGDYHFVMHVTDGNVTGSGLGALTIP